MNARVTQPNHPSVMRLSLLPRRTTATQALSSSAGKSSVMSTDHKQQAKRLRTSLAERGVEVTHSEALELVAHQHGARDWNTLAAAHAEVAPPRAGGFGPVIPVLRIFDVDKAREFYTDFLGFSIDWEHTFDDHAPVYLQASRDGAAAAPERAPRRRQPRRHRPHPRHRRAWAARELHERDYRYAKPGPRDHAVGAARSRSSTRSPTGSSSTSRRGRRRAAPGGRRQAAGPIEHEYVVACSPEHAFGVFTAEIGDLVARRRTHRPASRTW